MDHVILYQNGVWDNPKSPSNKVSEHITSHLKVCVRTRGCHMVHVANIITRNYQLLSRMPVLVFADVDLRSNSSEAMPVTCV